MTFDQPSAVDSVCYQLKLADFPRGGNRALINDLFNGFPPYTDEEVKTSSIAVNVNDLNATRLGHDARSQFYTAMLKPGNFFTCKTDRGPKHKRQKYAGIVQREINKVMKASMDYFEGFRSKIASCVLHGIGPAHWSDRDMWCPEAIGVEDALIPSRTLLTMRNVPLFAIYRSYTAPELIRMTRGPKVDPAWNMEMADRCIAWIDKEATALMGSNWPEVWAPEKLEERVKGDGVFYSSDSVPTIDVFDFYFWNDSDKEEGWNRRIILDSWSSPQDSGRGMARRSGYVEGADKGFLFNSANRKYGSKMSEIVAFQFADLSAVAPFHYHSVRSLGFMLYAVCHLENRLRCRFSEAVFENLSMYLRVKSMDDVQRALKVELGPRTFIDESVQFVNGNDRWQPNENFAELGLTEANKLVMQNSSSWTGQPSSQVKQTEKTKFQYMAELQAMGQLTSAALLQAYRYQKAEYDEIFRRFCRPNSRDPEVRTFRANCLRQSVPEKLLVPEAWELMPEQVMGQGNKTLEFAIAEQLIQMRPLYDPEPQRQILRDVTLAITDDPSRAEALVPDEPMRVTDSVHDAQLAAGTLMQGLPVALKTGMNHIEYVETLLLSLQLVIAKAQKSGGLASAEKIEGMQRIAEHITEHIKIIAQDPEEKARVKRYTDQLAKLMNLVRAMAQRLQEEMQKQNGQAQLDPKDAAKIAATQLTAQQKAENMRQSHAQRTAQRDIQFQQEQRHEQEKHAAELQATDLEAAANINRERMKSFDE